MPPFRDSSPNPDLLMTVTLQFLEKYNGTYASRATLCARLVAFLDKECDRDLSWLNRENDIDILIDLVIRSGGISVTEMPSVGGEVKGTLAGLKGK